MSTFPILAIAIGLILVVILAVAFVVYRQKGDRQEPDYRLFFILGITWLPLGIAIDNPGFWGMGAVFLLVGLLNRDKWKDQEKWSDLPSSQRNLKILLIALGLALTMVLGVSTFIIARQ